VKVSNNKRVMARERRNACVKMREKKKTCGEDVRRLWNSEFHKLMVDVSEDTRNASQIMSEGFCMIGLFVARGPGLMMASSYIPVRADRRLRNLHCFFLLSSFFFLLSSFNECDDLYHNSNRDPLEQKRRSYGG
jgi:hypothetical protein